MDLTADGVAAALQAAASRDYHQSQAASHQLDDWHKKPGFHSILQEIYLARQVPPELRLVALTQLKNGVDKHWKRGVNHSLNTEEQTLIRSRLLQDLFENAENTRFAPFQAIIIAKIARNDFPETWPTLFQDLISLLDSPQCSDQTRQTLVLTIIRHVIKEFASMRIMKSRKSFYEAAPPLMMALVTRGSRLLQQFVDDPSANAAQGFQAVNFFKCIRRLAIFGYEAPHKDETVRTLWTTSIQTLQGVLQFISNRRLVIPHTETFPSLLSQLTKLHLTMAATHPVAFSLMQGSVDLVRIYWQSACNMQELYSNGQRPLDGISASEKYFEDRVLILSHEHKTLTLLRACFKIAYGSLQILKYRATEEERVQPEQAKRIIRQELLTADFVQTLVHRIVKDFLIYDSESLQQWSDEPEEWEANQSEQEDAFDVSPRPCAERLLMDIALNYKESAVPLFLQMTQQAATGSVADRESAYAALGAAAPMIGEAFDFNQFLNAQLLQDLQDESPEATRLHYRIPILLSQWMPVGISEENKALVYSIYNKLLKHDDFVVKITTAKRFKDVADEFGFSPKSFAPYATDIFTGIVNVFYRASMPETILALLATMGSLIERMENEILPFADTLIQLLGPLWERMEKEQQMKKAVVGILARLVHALGSHSVPLQPLVQPMIKSALLAEGTTQLYLLEDSLELLQRLVEHAPSSTPQLLELVPMLLPLLDTHSTAVLVILYAYLMLDPAYMLRDDIRRSTFMELCPLLESRANDTVKATIEYIEATIQQAEQLHGQGGVQAATPDLVSTDILPAMFECLEACWSAHQTTGPNRRDAPPDARNETFYLTVMARLLTADQRTLLAAMQAHSTSRGRDAQQAFEHLLDEWYSHLDNVSMPGTRKRMVLALSGLLRTGEPAVLVRLQLLVAAWTSLLVELRDPPDAPESDSIVVPEAERTHWPTDSEHGRRRSRLAWADVIHSVPLPRFVREVLLETVAANGGDEAFRQHWLVNVDADVLAEFQGLGIF